MGEGGKEGKGTWVEAVQGELAIAGGREGGARFPTVRLLTVIISDPMVYTACTASMSHVRLCWECNSLACTDLLRPLHGRAPTQQAEKVYAR